MSKLDSSKNVKRLPEMLAIEHVSQDVKVNTTPIAEEQQEKDKAKTGSKGVQSSTAPSTCETSPALRILNLYAGIGGNRKLWGGNIEVTAVEIEANIAKIYKDNFPQDRVIVGDAHEYLLNHFEEYDFIWASPPCPTHSRARKSLAWKTKENGEKWLQNKPVYPDLKLYEEVLFLQGYYEGKWVVENVISWYDPLIKPFIYREHYYWSNFVIDGKENANRQHDSGQEALSKLKGFNLSSYANIDKTKILRNCVEPDAGLHIFNCAFKTKQETLITLTTEGKVSTPL